MQARWLFATAPLLLVARAAHAQPASAQAETLFRQARDLLDAGKTAEACAAFESSQKLGPTPTTQFSVAACREQNHQLATAWGDYIELQRQGRGATDPTLAQLAGLAGTKVSALEPRLSKLTITVAGDHAISGLEVRRDGEVIDGGAWNHPLPIDGGTYKITARAPGRADWSTTVTIKEEKDAQTIEIPALPAAGASTGGTGGTGGHTGGEVTTTSHSRIPAFAVAAGALVLGGAAIGFELSAESKNDKVADATTNAAKLSLWHSANNRRYVAEGLGAGAIAAAGVAVFLFVRHHGGESQPAVAIAPVASPGLTGLVLDAHF